MFQPLSTIKFWGLQKPTLRSKRDSRNNIEHLQERKILCPGEQDLNQRKEYYKKQSSAAALHIEIASEISSTLSVTPSPPPTLPLPSYDHGSRAFCVGLTSVQPTSRKRRIEGNKKSGLNFSTSLTQNITFHTALFFPANLVRTNIFVTYILTVLFHFLNHINNKFSLIKICFY